MSEVLKSLKQLPKHLMTGVSYMIPVVVAGGMLLAFSVMLIGEAAVPTEGFPGDLATIGLVGLKLFIPIMAAYVAYSMADRPGIAPGLIAGYLANDIGSGFLGALIAGILAGVVVILLKQIRLKKELESLMPIFIIPILGTLISSILILWVIGPPVAALLDILTNALRSMSEGNKAIFGAINGLMYAFDLGGVVNKTAYTFAVALMGEGVNFPMGMVAVCPAIPPLAMALAVFLNKKKYTEKERTFGLSALLMGLVGISEGAIPFAVKDPLHVIPGLMIGSAVGGAIAGAMGLESIIAWGSFISLPGVNKPVAFLIALVVGTVVAAFAVNFLKKDVVEEEEEE